MRAILVTHFEHIREGGLSVALRKLRGLAGRVLWPVLWIAAYPVIVLLRPFVLVRFGALVAGRIGHFCYDVAFYLAERELGNHPSRSLDLFFLRGEVSNNYLARLFRRYLWISKGARYALRIYPKLPGSGPHLLQIEASHRHGYRDIKGLLASTPRHVFLAPQEEDRGWAELARCFGTPRAAPIVCVQVRTDDYLNKIIARADNAREFRERNDHKNASIGSFIPAMNALASEGHWCFRMGALPGVPLQGHSDRVIDYANQGRSDFLDVFLASNCRFFVSTGSGVDAMGDLFRKPIVFCNQVTLEATHAWLPNVTIFKRLRDKASGRILTFREIVESGLGRAFDAREYRRRGVELIENTPEEIQAAVAEMLERLDRRYVEQPGDGRRQERFWDLLHGSPYQGPRSGWVGSQFLRDNEALLS